MTTELHRLLSNVMSTPQIQDSNREKELSLANLSSDALMLVVSTRRWELPTRNCPFLLRCGHVGNGVTVESLWSRVCHRGQCVLR